MKKYIISLLSVLALVIPVTVNAATGKITVTGKTSLNLNNYITVTVKVSETGGKPGSWSFGLQYDKSKLEYIGSSSAPLTIVDANSTGTKTSETYTYRFKAIATGKAVISIEDTYMIDYDTEKKVTVQTSSLSVNITKPVEVNYSSDNNLSSLKIEGFELTPAFDKSTLGYNVTVASGLNTIKIEAKASDSKAKVTGAGDVNLNEGTNVVEIVVTAENGAAKTYILNIFVPEKEPIAMNFRGKTYSVMRKIPENIPLGFEIQVLTINDEVIEALYNNKLKLTLVYATDEKGKSDYYRFAENAIVDNFLLITASDISIILINTDKDIKGMKEVFLKVYEQEIKAFQIKENDQFYIIKGMDLLTGETDYYYYDHDNGTISTFDEEGYLYLVNNITDFTPIIYGLGGAIIIQTLIIILMFGNKKKMRKIIKKYGNENKVEAPKEENKISEIEETESTKTKKAKKEKTILDE